MELQYWRQKDSGLNNSPLWTPKCIVFQSREQVLSLLEVVLPGLESVSRRWLRTWALRGENCWLKLVPSSQPASKSGRHEEGCVACAGGVCILSQLYCNKRITLVQKFRIGLDSVRKLQLITAKHNSKTGKSSSHGPAGLSELSRLPLLSRS